jgi:TPR repeat protein
MGMLYLLGQKGYPANIPEGVKLIRQSAVTSDFDAPQGAFVYALLLAGEFTVNVPESILIRDERAARRMLEKSSALGFSHAQQKLGLAYETGTWGCTYDPGLSLHYYSLAAKQGEINLIRRDIDK